MRSRGENSQSANLASVMFWVCSLGSLQELSSEVICESVLGNCVVHHMAVSFDIRHERDVKRTERNALETLSIVSLALRVFIHPLEHRTCVNVFFKLTLVSYEVMSALNCTPHPRRSRKLCVLPSWRSDGLTHTGI